MIRRPRQRRHLSIGEGGRSLHEDPPELIAVGDTATMFSSERPADKTLYIDLASGDRFSDQDAGPQPVPDDMPGVVGIFVGGCVKTGPGIIDPRHTGARVINAHAHTRDEFRGWICYRSPEVYRSPRYERTRWHEYAHLLSGEGHTEKWRQAMRLLGQPIPDRYARRARRKPSSAERQSSTGTGAPVPTIGERLAEPAGPTARRAK